MTTNTLPAMPDQQRTDPGLYQPVTESALSMGERLIQMQRSGRKVVNQQRDRWQRNRELYRGNTYIQYNATTGRLHQVAPSSTLGPGQRRDKVNRLRQFVDSRVAMMTYQRPPFTVEPNGYEHDKIEGARLATKFVRVNWDDPDGWNVGNFAHQLCLQAEQDGIAFANVVYDQSKGKFVKVGVDLQTGKPIADRKQFEAMKAMDPQGGTLWRMQDMPAGEVVFRVVRAGHLSIDPNMTDDWRDANWVFESRVRPIHEVEREFKVNVREMLKRQNPGKVPSGMTGSGSGGEMRLDVQDEHGRQRHYDPQHEVFVHTGYIRSTGNTGEWPQGAYVVFLEGAPDEPLIAAPWVEPDGGPRGLPYYPYVPRPDGMHLLRSQGTVDELAPVQAMYDFAHTSINKWLRLLAEPPLVIVGGSLRSKSVFNEKRLIHVNPGFGEPRFLQVPTAPADQLTARLGHLENEMSELSMVSDPSRGQAPGHGVEAAAAINMLIQKDEQQNSGAVRRFVDALQWSVSEGLKNVNRYYTIERMVSAPGVDDDEQFQAFRGQMLHGANRFRVNGSILPRNRAAQLQQLQGFLASMPPGSFDPASILPEIIENDVDSIVSKEKEQAQKQHRENRMLSALGRHPQRDELWSNFEQMRNAYAQAVMAIAKATPPELGVNPQQILAQQGIQPPRILDLCRQAGIPVPTVEQGDKVHSHMGVIQSFQQSDAWDVFPPIVKQAVREHGEEHLSKFSGRIAAMGMQEPEGPPQQQGSQPAEKGEAPEARQRQPTPGSQM